MLEYKNRSFVKVFTDTGRRADSGRIEKDTDKREKREKADQKRKPCGEKSAAFKSGKPCKRGLYIRISFSWKTHLFVIGACIAGMGVIGLLFQLKWKLLVIVLIAMFLALPAFILDTYKKCMNRNVLQMLPLTWSRCYMRSKNRKSIICLKRGKRDI